eukprot:29006-Pelagococcus_subviridis.AAC.8
MPRTRANAARSPKSTPRALSHTTRDAIWCALASPGGSPPPPRGRDVVATRRRGLRDDDDDGGDASSSPVPTFAVRVRPPLDGASRASPPPLATARHRTCRGRRASARAPPRRSAAARVAAAIRAARYARTLIRVASESGKTLNRKSGQCRPRGDARARSRSRRSA